MKPIISILAFISISASAAIYNIVSTDYYVNGMPPNLTTAQKKAWLDQVNISETDAAILAKKYNPLDTKSASLKVKELSKPVEPVNYMPIVDVSKEMTRVAGWSDLRVRPNKYPADEVEKGDGDGQFRIDCEPAFMSNDDPILYPNQEGRAHHHTFFGNTSLKYNSDLMKLNVTGNSTCRGGIANRSAYWIPSVIDTKTSAPLKPVSALWYYKTGYDVSNKSITAPVNGLRMIAGNMHAKSLAESKAISFNCFKEGQTSTESKTLPACPIGWQVVVKVGFPKCWDGKNLDSPNHIDHMSNPKNGSCPTSHPVAIPGLGLNIKYDVTTADGTKYWRLSSDNYKPDGYNAGYSGHADVVFGWDEKVINGIIKNCLNAGVDAGNHRLCDGRVIYGHNVNWQ